jgi:pimeloyl-ACP methyl ester carboxylesterase
MNGFNHQSGDRVAVGDARLYVEQAGDPQGQPLLLLHGGLGSLADFNPILERLPSNLRLIGMDLRGHGASTLGTASLTYRRYQDDVLAVLDHLGIARCAILGFSDGGIVGYRIAAQAPERVQALITVGAQWTLVPDGPVAGMLAGLTPQLWEEMFPGSRAAYEALNPAPDFAAQVQAVVGLWTDAGPDGYPGPAVAEIAAPTLIVRGDADPLLSLEEAVALQTQIAGAHLFNVPFAGHEVHVDAPDLLMPAVQQFLRQPGKRELEA